MDKTAGLLRMFRHAEFGLARVGHRHIWHMWLPSDGDFLLRYRQLTIQADQNDDADSNQDRTDHRDGIPI